MTAKNVTLILAILACLLPLSGCEKPVKPNDLPVSHWLNDPDPCISKTAAAIVASGRPWPNETWDEKHQKLIKFDFWIGDQLYELPGDTPLGFNGFGPHAHPFKYSSVSGDAESFLGIPKDKWGAGPSNPKIGSAITGNAYCNTKFPPNQWIEAKWTNVPTRNEAIALSLSRWREAQKENPERILRVEVNERSDIEMTEILSYTNLPRTSSAGYFPKKRDLVQIINGKRVVKGIGCSSPHDAITPQPSSQLPALCGTWIYLGPGLYFNFAIPQQMLPIFPDLHDKLLATFEQSRKK